MPRGRQPEANNRKIATTSVHKLDADGVTFDHGGNNAYYSEVAWSSENRMHPGEAGRFG